LSGIWDILGVTRLVTESSQSFTARRLCLRARRSDFVRVRVHTAWGVRHETGAAPRRRIEEGQLMAPVTNLVVAAPNINSDGIVQWGVQNIVPILLLVVGIGIIASARKGRMSENAMTITNVMLGCAVIAGAALFYGFADNIANFVFQS
jgi:hypothetical protein